MPKATLLKRVEALNCRSAGRLADEQLNSEKKSQVDRYDVAECVLETKAPVAFDLTGEIEATCFYAGQSAGLVHDIVAAGELVRRIGAEAEAALARAESLRRQ